ncbi:HdeD family acid-resistance protein [Roseateles sp. BYS180W]|uniref:HdeD family acid-resistance protein n=1 Tax=Roseateles rivi TaxID=3299028 RepID=A0ABW7FWU2_9BURK
MEATQVQTFGAMGLQGWREMGREAASSYAWLMLLRGVLSVGAAVLLWMYPLSGILALVFLFGCYTLVDGVMSVVLAVIERKALEHWVAMLLWGLLGIFVGVVSLMRPELAALSLSVYMAVWALFVGGMQVVTAVRLRKIIEHEGWLVFGGLLLMLAGAAVMVVPAAGLLAMLGSIGAVLLLYGGLNVWGAYKLHLARKALEQP